MFDLGILVSFYISELEHIHKNEWTSYPGEYAFCVPENGGFCSSFQNSDENQNITIHHPGIYQLSCKVTWRPLHPNDKLNAVRFGNQSHVFSAELSVLKWQHDRPTVLAVDHTASNCNDNTGSGRVPCAQSYLQVRAHLRKHDQVLVQVTYKGLLKRSHEHSFLEITKAFDYS